MELSPETRRELDSVRAAVRRDGLYDHDAKKFIAYRPSIVDYYPETLPGYVATEDEAEAQRREQLEAADLAYIQRDPSDKSVLQRWNQPPDVLDVLEAIDADDARATWTERMTEFRERELHGLLWTYFGTKDYAEKEIVLAWHQVNGHWTPKAKLNVLLWIELEVEAGGSKLAGYAAAAGTVRAKIAVRRKNGKA